MACHQIGRNSKSIPWIKIEVCTYCYSTDQRRVHYTLPNWDVITPTKLYQCCICQHYGHNYKGCFTAGEMNVVVSSNIPIHTNSDGTIRFIDQNPEKFDYHCLNICDTDLDQIGWVKDVTYKFKDMHYHVVPHQTLKNRGVLFCPYWLKKTNFYLGIDVPALMSSALIPGVPYTGRPTILSIQNDKLLNKFGMMHLDKISYPAKAWCLKCTKIISTCLICGTTIKPCAGFNLCSDTNCWGMFQSMRPTNKVNPIYCSCLVKKLNYQ